MEPVVIGRSDLGEGLLDPAGAIPPRGRVLLGGGQPVVFIVPLTAGDVRGVVEQIEAAASEPICSSGVWTTWMYLRGFQVRN